MPGKIKQALKKAKNKRYKKQLAKGEKKGTNVYMGRGIGTVTAKTARKNRKAISGVFWPDLEVQFQSTWSDLMIF